MSGQLFLAQNGAFWASSSKAPSTNLVVIIGVCIFILILILIIKNRLGSSGSSSSFNKAAFRKSARSVGLAEDEVRALEEYGRALSLTNPEFIFRNPQKLAMLFSARERVTHERAKGGAVRSTRQLGRGAPLTFIAPGEESYPSIILAVEPSGLAVEPVADSYGEAIRFKRGTKLTCFFYTKGHEGYQFATRVAGWEKIGSKDAMVLAHSEAVNALPARRHARREMKAPCTFYRVAVTAAKAGASVAKNQQKSAAKVENTPYPGTIVDISAGGLGIQCVSPLQSGEFVKITFNPGSGAQAAFAKVIRMNRSKNVGGIMHVQFVKISRQSLNAILSFVYGYAD